MTRRLTVYVRSGCHLCDDMLQALAEWRSQRAFELDVVDILGKPELESAWGTKIPVLAAEGREICHYYLDPLALEQYIGSA
ncbi:MAG TPA: glutaredoxin family protein [Chromatiales bacterium]|nr:glutaredoxin family protein [Chromatiales bacterium]